MPDERRSTNIKLEIEIARLQENFSALEKKVDSGNLLILNEIKDLKDNLAGRLERVEVTKLAASDFIAYKTEMLKSDDDFEKRIRSLETDRDNLKGRYTIIAIFATTIVSAIVTLILKHY